MGFGGRSDDVKAGDASVEPEASHVGQVGDRNFGVEIEQDADVVTAGFVDEVVEVVECTVGRVDCLRVLGVGLNCGEEESIDAERLDVFEMLRDPVETVAVEVNGIDLVDDGMLPPDVGADSGASPAGAREDLGFALWGVDGVGECASEKRV